MKPLMKHADSSIRTILEALYDAVDSPKIDRVKIRVLLDRITARTELIQAAPLQDKFIRPELERIVGGGHRRDLLLALESHFGQVVRREHLMEIMRARSSKDALIDKNLSVAIHKIRRSLQGTPYGIKTQFGIGFALVPSEKSGMYTWTGGRAAAVPTVNANNPWRGVYLSDGAIAVAKYLESTRGPHTRSEIINGAGVSIYGVTHYLNFIAALTEHTGMSLVRTQRAGEDAYMLVESTNTLAHAA